MTTPPPPSSPAWPSSGTIPSPQPPSWWTTTRVALAIVLVVGLMTVSAIGGFFAGVAWNGVDTLLDDFEDFEDFDDIGLDGPDASLPVEEGALLRPGDTVQGMITSAANAAHRFTLERAQSVTIEIVEADFDTVIHLIDASGTVIETDDDGGSGTNSRIDADLAQGAYRVQVEAFFAGSGRYSISLD